MPKLFISYSWTNPDHAEWVLRLATELREAGVDVIFDKWDLKEGQDSYAFMEKMVTEADVNKVIMVCDKSYVAKTNDRSGGVGTEAQIITPEIYGKTDQSKFVAVIAERDNSGAPCVPAYYRSRIYIDLSEEAARHEGFEKLLRWIYDKPVHVKPNLGTRPKFLDDRDDSVRLATSALSTRCVDALRSAKSYSNAALSEYLDLVSSEFAKLRLVRGVEPFDEAVVSSFRAFRPYLGEYLTIVRTVALYGDTEDTRTLFRRFFERIAKYMEPQRLSGSWNQFDFDNFKLIVYELFLFTLVTLIEHDRFQFAAALLDHEYYVAASLERSSSAMVSFSEFNRQAESLETQNARNNPRRYSVRADLMKEISAALDINFDYVMAVDLSLYLRSKKQNGDLGLWWPDTLVYADRSDCFELFGRSRSQSYFEKVKLILGVSSKAELEVLIAAINSGQWGFPKWGYRSLNVPILIGLSAMCTTK